MAGEVCHNGTLRSSAHVLMIPYPAQPHIVPMLDLAHKLTSCGGVTVTFVSFQVLIDRLLLKHDSARGSWLTDSIHLVGVPDDRPGYTPPVELPKNPIVLRESLQLGYNLEPFVLTLLHEREASGLQGPTCLLSDFIHWWTIDVASRLDVPRYILVVSPACQALVYLSVDENGSMYEDDSSVIQLQGLPPITARQLPMSLWSHMPHTKAFRTRWPKSVRQCAGILANTCLALEAQVIESARNLFMYSRVAITVPPTSAHAIPICEYLNLQDKPILPVGPLALSLSPGSVSKNLSMEGLQLTDQVEVMNWLDQQPSLSVLYVSFGTTGLLNLGKRHMLELARGLEDSQQRFIWVLRSPNGVKENADFLPAGFKERVKGRGLLLRGWAPQLQILGHPSTGGFLSSCGWNSATESLSRGVPIIGWPSFADQPLICRYMEAVHKVAIELPQQSDFFVEAEEIKKTIIMVMQQSEESRAMRERVETFKTSIAEALGPRGTSTQGIQKFADLLRHPASA